MSETGFAVRQYLPGTEQWLPVESPISCNYVGIRNRGAVKIILTTDPDNPAAIDDLDPGAQEVISAPARNCPRFQQGAIVMFLKTETGSGKASCQFIE